MNFAMRIRKRKLAMAALAAIVAVVTIVAQEAWNGLVKTDMASIGATRDVSQSPLAVKWHSNRELSWLRRGA